MNELQELFFDKRVNADGNGPINRIEWEKIALLFSVSQGRNLEKTIPYTGEYVFKRLNKANLDSKLSLFSRMRPVGKYSSGKKYVNLVMRAADELKVPINVDLLQQKSQKKESKPQPPQETKKDDSKCCCNDMKDHLLEIRKSIDALYYHLKMPQDETKKAQSMSPPAKAVKAPVQAPVKATMQTPETPIFRPMKVGTPKRKLELTKAPQKQKHKKVKKVKQPIPLKMKVIDDEADDDEGCDEDEEDDDGESLKGFIVNSDEDDIEEVSSRGENPEEEEEEEFV